MDYTKAFVGVEHQQLWTVMREPRFPKRTVSLIEALYSEQQSAVRTDSGTPYWFSVSKGVRQGCIVSPQLFSVYTESIMREVEEEQNNSEYDELSINADKTKIMKLDKWQENTNIVIDNINVERVQSFQYMGAMFTTKWRRCFQHKTVVGDCSAIPK